MRNWKITYLDDATEPEIVRAYEPQLRGEFFVFYAGDVYAPHVTKAIRASLIAKLEVSDA